MISQGEILEETEEYIKEVIELYIESLGTEGLPQKFPNLSDPYESLQCLNYQLYPEKKLVNALEKAGFVVVR
ncbi:hypothetical protein [Methanosarcina sp.]|uniref:type II toxin-antitoxin system HicB family antitoxin n=1 Tax=Methanosarcina sp. TaxID=2213 RepID=UPI003C716A3B